MNTLKQNVTELNNMILEGKLLEAFDKFYADDVTMQDNEHPARVGKKECREFEENFIASLTAFRGASLKNVMISEEAGVSACEWSFDYSHKEWGDRKYTQLAVQRWKDGKIVSEKFVYNA
jgi:hypothetical protein